MGSLVIPKSNDVCWCGSGRKYKRCHKPLEGRIMPGVISPYRPVPPNIERPPYADTGVVQRRPENVIKEGEILERMRTCARLAAEILELAGRMVAPGVTTDAIDAYVHELSIERGGYPSTLNYHGYRKSLCTSVNEIICHGIPDDRPLEEGDIVNLDVTLYLGGVHGDTNATFAVGAIDEVNTNLIEVTRECMWKGIEAVVPCRPISDIGRAIEDHARSHRLGVVRSFIGHGIGEQFHTD
ncbi:MAG: type I methionyl aminopeptidase, partial [Acidimicrobiia bacterium]